MTALSVNLNKVALLRNQRDLSYPSVPEMARIALAAGADGITVHPRPDERHIRRTDVTELAAMLAAEYRGRGVEFNIEGYPAEPFLALVEQVKPDQVTLVPDAPDQRTSDHGWDAAGEAALLKPAIERLHAIGARVSLFVDPEPRFATDAAAVGADRIELYTEPFHQAHAAGKVEAGLAPYRATADAALAAGLGLNAGHDLTLDNLPALLAAIPEIDEVSIGHAIIADALKMGMDATVRAYAAVAHANAGETPRAAIA